MSWWFWFFICFAVFLVTLVFLVYCLWFLFKKVVKIIREVENLATKFVAFDNIGEIVVEKRQANILGNPIHLAKNYFAGKAKRKDMKLARKVAASIRRAEKRDQ